MKQVLSVLALAAASSLAVPALAHSGGTDTTKFQARATGTAEWWPNNSSGTAVATVDLEGYDLLVDMPFIGLTGSTIYADIHCCTSESGYGSAPLALPLVGFPVGVREGHYSATLQLAENWTYDPAFLDSTGGTAKGGFLTIVHALDVGLCQHPHRRLSERGDPRLPGGTAGTGTGRVGPACGRPGQPVVDRSQALVIPAQ